MSINENQIRAEFQTYLQQITQKYILVIVGLAILVIGGFGISDIFFRENIYAFFTRLIPLSLAIPLCIFQIRFKNKYSSLKFKWYNLLTAMVLVMMYAKYLVYIYEEGAGYSVTGIVAVIFIISLDLKTNNLNTIFIFFLTTILFTAALFIIPNIPKDKIVNLTNVYPMVILGFALNRVQFKLRYKLFLSNYLLQEEKQTTKQLYEETRVINEDLIQKNEEIKVQHQAIDEKNKQLEELNATKDTFFSIISHDLRATFNAMLGFSNLLNSNYDSYDSEKQKKYLANINNSINNTYKLLENLLSWAQMQQSKLSLDIKKENLYMLIEEVCEIQLELAKNKSITLKNKVDKALNVNADKNALKTVLRNLASNAIKYSLIKGTIEFSSSIDSNKSHVVVTVADNGSGIEPEIKQKLFKLNEKVSTKGTNNETGTGLGLILCKELMEKQKGEIWVESEVGYGSKFHFTIPISQN